MLHDGLRTSRTSRASTWSPSALVFTVLLTACRGDVVTLGEKPPPTYHFGPPRLVTELASTSRSNNATLTADLLEIYFSSSRDQNDLDIWTASRASRLDPFTAPQKVRAVNSSRTDTGSAISADGLTLWIASDRRGMGTAGGLDIYVSTRSSRASEWTDPELVSALNSPQFDIPRPPGQGGLTMPMGSERGPGSIYRSWFATRETLSAPFDVAPQAIAELVFETTTTMDAFLSMDGLDIFYASEPVNRASSAADASLPNAADGSAPDASPSDASTSDAGSADAGSNHISTDLFFGERVKVSHPFSGFRAITELNTPFEERDPWMSEDKTQFFFASDRGGNMNIYTSDVILK